MLLKLMLLETITQLDMVHLMVTAVVPNTDMDIQDKVPILADLQDSSRVRKILPMGIVTVRMDIASIITVTTTTGRSIKSSAK